MVTTRGLATGPIRALLAAVRRLPATVDSVLLPRTLALHLWDGPKAVWLVKDRLNKCTSGWTRPRTHDSATHQAANRSRRGWCYALRPLSGRRTTRCHIVRTWQCPTEPSRKSRR